MIEAILGDLETSRSQIEGKFSRAGTILESAVSLISQQLEYLQQLSGLLDGQAVGEATRELTVAAGELRSLPTMLRERGQELRDLECRSVGLLSDIEDMRSLLRYLLVFALNLKITAADDQQDAQLVHAFSQEMRTRIEVGVTELDDIDMRLNELLDQVRAALKLESDLAEDVHAMVPAVPNRLADDATAIRAHQKQISDMTGQASALAQNIQLKVVDALSSLQIGDISRQRIEHIQNGLNLLTRAEAGLAENGLSEDARERFAKFVCRLLATQLADTADGFERDSRGMLANMSGMAADAQSLLRLQQTQGSSVSHNNLRSLERSVGDAEILVTDMEQAVATANDVRSATALTVDELLRRIDAIKGVREDVQFMALNTTVSCSRMGDAGKPLQVIAIELRLYAKKLGSIADVTLAALRSLGEDVANLNSDRSQTSSKSRLESAAARLRDAADLAESGLATVVRHGTDVVDSLSQAESELNFDAEFGNVLSTSATSLHALAGEGDIEVADILGPLQDIFDAIAATYTMARERDIHAQCLPNAATVARAA
ncbi:MAG: hypothetical protein JSR78_18245 [Proteobacteria bacterium]|nr:hypothetical protein [Pseudomonadota bacterium]